MDNRKLKNKAIEWEELEEINEENKHLFPNEFQKAFEAYQSKGEAFFFPEKNKQLQVLYNQMDKQIEKETLALLKSNPDSNLRDILLIFLKKWPVNIDSQFIINKTKLVERVLKSFQMTTA